MSDGIIYKITQLSTGRAYVGLTTNSLANRWSAHVSKARKGTGHLAYAIRADGRDGFYVEILERAREEDLPELERKWIAKLGTVFPGGLNGNSGGSTVGRQRNGNAEKARQISLEKGVCMSTAKRWVREGVERDGVRRYENHGATGTALWKRWHGMKRRGGEIAPEWQSFPAFVESLGPDYNETRRIVRRDKSRPWGPDNFDLKKGWNHF